MLSGENPLLTAEFQTAIDVPSAGDPTRIYKMLPKPISAGGMAQIHKAFDSRLGKVVAIKTGKLGTNDGGFPIHRELSAHAKSDNPYIIPLYDKVEVFGGTGIVMEYAELDRAVLLSEYVKGKQFVREDFLIIAQQLGKFIDLYARKGNFHRDLKLSNVFFYPLQHDKFIRVIDLGLSGDADSDASARADGKAVGTPDYLSPQRWNGEATKLTDEVYALGMMLYLLLVQRKGYSSSIDIFERHHFANSIKNFSDEMRNSVLIKEWGVNPDLVAGVLGRALHPDEQKRFQNGAQLFAALEHAMQRQQVTTEVKESKKGWREYLRLPRK